MQLKKAVMSIILPVMESNGFSLIESAAGYYKFGFNDDSLRVIVDRHPWPPAQLRVDLKYRDHRRKFSHFELDQLYDYKDLDLFYNNQEELELKLKTIANILDTYALSFLMSMRDNQVFWKEETHQQFSIDPKKQASSYAKSNSLTMSYELTNFLFLENQVTLMRGDSMCSWRHTFEQHTDEIIGLASYYGEVIRRRGKGKWEAGLLVYDQGTGYPSYEVVDYWNRGLYIPACRLVPSRLRYHIAN